MNDMRLEKIREYIACPELGDTHYGRWGILTCEQRLTIYHLLQKIDNYDKLIRSLLEENAKHEAEIKKLKKGLTIHFNDEQIKKIKDDCMGDIEYNIDAIKQQAITEFVDKACRLFAGHSDYHGDTVLSKLRCLAEGKEVKNAKPLEKG